MRKLMILSVLLLSLANGASWRYASDGCTKLYAVGSDSSECFDKKRNILAYYGRLTICTVYPGWWCR